MNIYKYLLLVLLPLISCNDKESKSTSASYPDKQVNNHTYSSPEHKTSIKLVRPYKDEVLLEAVLYDDTGSTPKDGILSEVIIVDSEENLINSKKKLIGKIVFYKPKIDKSISKTMVEKIIKNGGLAIITKIDSRTKKIFSNNKSIPALQLSNSDINLIETYINEAPVQLYINLLK